MMTNKDEFWTWWRNRLTRNSTKFITPDNRYVRKELREIDLDSGSEEQTIINTWKHVHNTIEYKLSKEWKTPQETIKEGVGDCEDFTFLIASMMNNVGVEDNIIQAGKLTYPHGKESLHTWNAINGMVVDGTGMPEDIRKLKYKKVLEFEVV